MITDDRLDQLVRASLEWQASGAALTQPSLEQTVGRVADRLGSRGTALRPGPVAVPATRSALRLVAIVLLLAAMVGTVVVVGSLLLRQPPPLPGPFGFASACGDPLGHGVLLRFDAGAGEGRLFPNGSLVNGPIPQPEDESPLTTVEYVEGVVLRERRLTQRGVDLIKERVAQLELTPGCHTVRTRETTASFFALTADGVVGVAGYPAAGETWLERSATPEEEAALAALLTDLAQVETWLPDDAWIHAAERRVQPHHWEVSMNISQPIGSDRGYDAVVLPGGVAPASFGDDVGDQAYRGGSGSATRWGIVDRADALLLAQSMDAARALGWIQLDPAFQEVGEYVPANDGPRPAVEDEPLPTPNVADDLAEIDPCSLVPQDAALAITGRDDRRSGESWELGVPGRMCGLIDQRVMGMRARVHLHPRSVDENAAEKIARGVLGDGAVADSMADWAGLVNDCMAADLPCAWGIAVWSEPYLVIVEIDARRDVTPQAARSFVEAVLREIRRLHD